MAGYRPTLSSTDSSVGNNNDRHDHRNVTAEAAQYYQGFPPANENKVSPFSSAENKPPQQKTFCEKCDPRLIGLFFCIVFNIMYALNSQPSWWASESAECYNSAFCTDTVKKEMSKQFSSK